MECIRTSECTLHIILKVNPMDVYHTPFYVDKPKFKNKSVETSESSSFFTFCNSISIS